MVDSREERLDAIIVGAGMAGLYMLYKLRGHGLNVRVIEAGTDVGGTWYWNRYPGCRCDVPSVEYSYSFSKELEQEWDWTELMAGQPEILRYMNHVADRFDLRRDVDFETRVRSASYDEQSASWTVETDTGEQYDADFCIMATGCLSMPNTPNLAGADSFKGEVYHTGRWPKQEVDFTGKRVGVIGAGSSAIQTIPVLAESAAHLYAFQRSPAYSFPAKNHPLAPGYMERAKADYPKIRAGQRNSPIGVVYYTPNKPDPGKRWPSQNILDLSSEQRRQEIKEFGFRALSQYGDVHSDPKANEVACDLYRETLKELVYDPEVAEKLAPRNYPLGCKRPIIDTDYYETFNRENVSLVDLREEAIEAITPTGLRTVNREFEFDVLVYATGFDAMTGALNRIDIRGRRSQALAEKWEHGPRSYLGLQIRGFPNLFTITGPGSPSVLSNVLVSIEQHVDWISDCIVHMQDGHLRSIEPEQKAEDAWIDHVNDVASGTMFTAPSCNSWYLGSNIPGKTRIFMPYIGGVHTYRKKCEEIVADGYRGFEFAR